jgi:hypothetical protein
MREPGGPGQIGKPGGGPTQCRGDQRSGGGGGGAVFSLIAFVLGEIRGAAAVGMAQRRAQKYRPAAFWGSGGDWARGPAGATAL